MIYKMELKEQIKKYFTEKHFDVTLDLLFRELNLKTEDLPLLEYCLNELVEQGFVSKSKTSQGHFEYDPGEKLDFGGMK